MTEKTHRLLVHDIPGARKRRAEYNRQGRKMSVSERLQRLKIERTINTLHDRSYTPVAPLKAVAWVTSEPVGFADRETGRRVELDLGGIWAKEVFDCAWFHVTGEIPAGIASRDVVFLVNTGGEGLVYTSEGKPVQGVTCYASNFDYSLGMPMKKVVLNNGLTDGNRVDFYIDAAANDLFGNLKNEARLQELCVAVCNENIRGLAYDIEVLVSVFDNTMPDFAFGAEIFETLRGLCAEGAAEFTDEAARAARERLVPLLSRHNTKPTFTYTAIGHAHIDLAWLWPIRESKRKAARTFCNQFVNMDCYDGYVFGASQAQLYQWVKDCYPALYSEVHERVAAGRWELQGATWVEMDSNLISGESMIRQFYYGKRFFREEFGQDMQIFWVPDSFGYSACVPQVMVLADVPFFLTQKISWNTVNKFPYHTFYWNGLDGSKVFAHMLPESTYNSPMHAAQMCLGERNYSERAVSDRAVMLFGIGDGGGGPGFEHLERGQRYHDLEGLPRVEYGMALPAMVNLRDAGVTYPTHSGELYLEKHQGTYTTQSRNKRYNRKIEFALRNEECAQLLFDARGLTDITLGELEALWKEVLLYQFHDILPGSSINRVYEESRARYAIMLQRVTEDTHRMLRGTFREGTVANLTSFAYDGVIQYGGEWYNAILPPMSVTPISDMTPHTQFTALAEEGVLSNDMLRVTMRGAKILTILDKTTGKQIVPEGAAFGALYLYSDLGDCWDMQDTSLKYKKKRERAKAVGTTFTHSGACAIARTEYIVGRSTVYRTITLTDGSPVLGIDYHIDYHDKQSMLRVEFPVAVTADTAAFNLQFGHLYRPTTEKNSVDKAQIEVCGQKFVDLSCDEFGVSVINDSKYGFRVKGSTIDVNLVRSPKGGPGHDVDQCVNNIRFGVYVHSGKVGIETYKHSYFLNNPIFVNANGVGEIAVARPYHTDNEAVVLESVKAADTGDGFIARYYNCTESEQRVQATFEGYEQIGTVGVMENDLASNSGEMLYRPFELKLVRYRRA